jgi:hypothetical protein
MTPKMIGTLEAEVIAEMLAEFPDTPVTMSSQPISPTAALYAVFHVIASDEALPVGMGKTARSRNVGVVQLDVLGPRDMGAGPTGDIAYHIGQFLKRREILVAGEGLIVMKDPTIRDFGVNNEEHRYVMRCPYRYDFS